MLENKIREPVFERLAKKIEEAVTEDIKVITLDPEHRGVPVCQALFDLHRINQSKSALRIEQQIK